MSYVSELAADTYNRRFTNTHFHGSAPYHRNVWRRAAEVSWQVGAWLGKQFLAWLRRINAPQNLGRIQGSMLRNPTVGAYSWRAKGLQRFHWRAWRISTSLGLIIRQLSRNEIKYLLRCIYYDGRNEITEKVLWSCLRKVQNRRQGKKPLGRNTRGRFVYNRSFYAGPRSRRRY